ncbi:MAG: hypothetical protein LBC99_10325 [Spirochaetota bacterium]|nr:hypothetical protein [Spirochaetota bacterium]
MLFCIVLVSVSFTSAAEMQKPDIGVLGIYLGMPHDEFLQLCSNKGLRLTSIHTPEGWQVYGGGGIDIEGEDSWISVSIRGGHVFRIYSLYRSLKNNDTAEDCVSYFKTLVSLIMGKLGEPVYNDQAYIISSVLANWETNEYSVTVFNLRSESVTVEYRLKL